MPMIREVAAIAGGKTVALQGSIDTFALPDVLRLLASTRKSGRLRLSGDRGEGSLWVRDGSLVAVEAPGQRRGGNQPATIDAVFELLRFQSGDFSFDHDQEAPDPAPPLEVEDVVSSAEERLEELRSLERVVPSEHVWISLRPGHLRRVEDEVNLNGAEWQVVCAVGAGITVAGLRAELSRGELEALRAVRDLVERGLLELDEERESSPEALEPAETVSTPALAALADDEPAEASEPDDRFAPEQSGVEPTAPPDWETEGQVSDGGELFQPETAIEADDAGAAVADDLTESEPTADLSAPERPEGLEYWDGPVLQEDGSQDVGPPADSQPERNGSEPSVRESFEVFVGDAHGAALNPEAARIGREGDVEPAGPLLDDLPSVPRPDQDEPRSSGGSRHDAAHMARQLANLSPAAAKAVAAAARAETVEDREEALSGIPPDEAELNRDLLLKFLSSTKA